MSIKYASFASLFPLSLSSPRLVLSYLGPWSLPFPLSLRGPSLPVTHPPARHLPSVPLRHSPLYYPVLSLHLRPIPPSRPVQYTAPTASAA
ncbi:hypothetical protein CDV36_005516 [Fusarium kuroshium]|uniref:Uncharacterized protein n=1 Tax=Fusarium kuroshium TaxID=2010991 RepID=A0A3M2SBD8_9HYPO|nr:hypothetical protein CDV36_005516 [Fusarium kuroshium]